MLGGEIDLESEEGKGTRFSFTLAYEGKTAEKGSGQYTTPEKQQADQLKDMTLLIVEDDSTADLFITEILNGRCRKIVHAKNGKEAVELLREREDIDLVLMDIKMPEMDGYTATKKIREFNNDVVIIAQTAYALSGDREKAISAGCDDYLTKPIDEEEFFSVLSNNLPEKS
jgi:CheY-like chemotaxis protein